MNAAPSTNKPYMETVVKTVHVDESGYTVTFEDGWSLGVSSDLCKQHPLPGEPAILFGKGIGFPIRGVIIGGRVYSYVTEEERLAKAEQDEAKRGNERAREYEARRAEYDERVKALPEPFRERIEGFRERGGDEWRHEVEAYELFVCEQAVIISAAVDNATLLEKGSSDFKFFKDAVPDLSDDHSGNTFGAALSLARIDHGAGVEYIHRAHAALCPVIGCREASCWATTVKSAFDAHEELV